MKSFGEGISSDNLSFLTSKRAEKNKVGGSDIPWQEILDIRKRGQTKESEIRADLWS